jgi:hypothetical protein
VERRLAVCEQCCNQVLEWEQLSITREREKRTKTFFTFHLIFDGGKERKGAQDEREAKDLVSNAGNCVCTCIVRRLHTQGL